MSVYVPLATKYRPQRFADVIGQDITLRIITNGMMKNRLGAAMLFSGTRGIGKTTIARILAKAFRCENSDPEPCGKCKSCQEFLSNSQIDVIEIDAASNTGVDDVREIIESCRYKPTSGKFKIFIIDEVHMLSKSAFNALLKTLEEPPEHVKFLLATTETYKIPETILSRVLKFDLKRVDAALIAQYLSSICNQENIAAGSDVLSLIAKAADGSIRDSLSILDQVINISDGNRILVEDVREMLHFSDDSDVVELLSLIISSNVKIAIAKYREIINSNVSCEKIASAILDYTHTLMCIKNNVAISENTIPNYIIDKLEDMAQNVSVPALSMIWQMLIRGMDEMKICDKPEIVLEMLIVRIVYAAGLPDLHELISGSCEMKSSNGNRYDRSANTESSDFNGNKIKSVENTIINSSSEKITEEIFDSKSISKVSLFDQAVEMFPNALIS